MPCSFNFRFPAGHVAFAAILAFATSVLIKPAAAEDNSSSWGSFLSYMGVSSAKKDPDAIDYQARAPLVVPPSNNLPKPKESSRDPAWPQNPDLAKERRAALESRRPVPVSNPNGRVAGADAQPTALPAESPPDTCEASGIGFCLSTPWHAVTSLVTGMSADPVVQPGNEPTRRYLIEPPPGYRKASAVPQSANDKQSPTDKNEDTGGKNGGFFNSFFRGPSVDDRTGMDMKTPTSN